MPRRSNSRASTARATDDDVSARLSLAELARTEATSTRTPPSPPNNPPIIDRWGWVPTGQQDRPDTDTAPALPATPPPATAPTPAVDWSDWDKLAALEEEERLAALEEEEKESSAAVSTAAPSSPPPPPAQDFLLTTTTILSPNSMYLNQASVNVALQATILEQRKIYQPQNTDKAYKPKIAEWKAYCDLMYKGEPFPHAVSPDKLLPFMFYQCMREKRPVGGKSRKGVGAFDPADYQRVVDQYSVYARHLASGATSTDPKFSSMPEPTNPLQGDALGSYRAAIRYLWQEHRMKNLTSYRTWEELWSPPLVQLAKVCVRRGPMNKMKNYAEKITHHWSPTSIVHRFPDLEAAMWKRGHDSVKSAIAWLRHRYCFLHSTHGLLRCESIFKGELSDLSMLFVASQPHKMRILIQQLAIGKTNQEGRKLFGRVLRNRKVELCGVGSFAMYLALRFEITQEFRLENFPLSNWMTNELWYDIKIMVDVFSTKRDWKEPIKNGSYAKAVKSVLQQLNIASSHYVHLGRKIGPKELEMLNASAEAIRQMGNWELSVQEQRYSTHLPMEALRLKAGFPSNIDGGSSTHHNPRQEAQPPATLLMATPFAFCYDAQEYMKEEMENWTLDHPRPDTAIAFLELVHELNVILLQDMAAICVLHPDRMDHPLFTSLHVLHMPQWAEYVEAMKSSLEAQSTRIVDDTRTGITRLLPGVIDQFTHSHGLVKNVETVIIQHLEQMENKFDTKLATVDAKITGMQEDWNTMGVKFLKAIAVAVAAVVQDHEVAEPRPRLAQGTTTLVATPTIPTPTATTTIRTPPTTFPIIVPRPHPKYASLFKMWRDWHKRFEEREVTQTHLWRKPHYSGSEQKHFSMVKQVISGIKKAIEMKKAEGEGVSDLKVIEDMEATYAADKCSLLKTVRWMQNKKLLVKAKGRGKAVVAWNKKEKRQQERQQAAEQRQAQEVTDDID
jgi:hypothetical protein